jgi:hypothetical protein
MLRAWKWGKRWREWREAGNWGSWKLATQVRRADERWTEQILIELWVDHTNRVNRLGISIDRIVWKPTEE